MGPAPVTHENYGGADKIESSRGWACSLDMSRAYPRPAFPNGEGGMPEKPESANRPVVTECRKDVPDIRMKAVCQRVCVVGFGGRW